MRSLEDGEHQCTIIQSMWLNGANRGIAFRSISIPGSFQLNVNPCFSDWLVLFAECCGLLQVVTFAGNSSSIILQFTRKHGLLSRRSLYKLQQAAMTREYVHFGPCWTSWEELLCVKRMYLCQTLNQQVAEAKYQGLFLLLPKNGLGQ